MNPLPPPNALPAEMAKIVVLSVPTYGHLIPMLGVIAELVRRGDDVVVCNDVGFESLIRATGASFVAYPQAMTMLDFVQTLKDGNLIAAFELYLGATPVLTDFCLARLPAEKPDVVVFDALAFWGAIATKTLKLRTVSYSPIFVFAFFQHLLGPAEFWGHLKNFIPRMRKLAWAWTRLLRFGIGNWPLYAPMIPLRGDKTVLLTSRELHPKSPLFDDPRWVFPGASIDARTRPDTFDFSKLDGRPVIYVSLGTLQFLNDAFFRLVMDTFADYPAQFLLAAGPGSDVNRFGQVPGNFIVQQTFPQMPLLERTALFITHGGLGSVHETLWNGVPFVAVPQHFEQLRNAMAAARHGAGIILDAQCYGRPLTAQMLRDAVEKVMADPGYRENAGRLGETLKAGGGYKTVADMIENVADNR
jgi:MGT family glycosyltransferase